MEDLHQLANQDDLEIDSRPELDPSLALAIQKKLTSKPRSYDFFFLFFSLQVDKEDKEVEEDQNPTSTIYVSDGQRMYEQRESSFWRFQRLRIFPEVKTYFELGKSLRNGRLLVPL